MNETEENEWAIEITFTDGEVVFYKQIDNSELGALRYAWKISKKEYVEAVRIYRKVMIEPFGHEWKCVLA